MRKPCACSKITLVNSDLLMNLRSTTFALRLFSSCLSSMSKPRCYFDISIGGKAVGRIEFEVCYCNKL